jgi:hypothetical protein
MTTISIAQDFKDDYITREAGERLRSIILREVKEKGAVEIDFTRIIVGSTSFFDEAFAKLIDHDWTRKDLTEKLILKNLNANDKKVLDWACKERGI